MALLVKFEHLAFYRKSSFFYITKFSIYHQNTYLCILNNLFKHLFTP